MVGFNKQVMDMVNNLRPMDDEFFKLLAGIKDVCQEIIRTLLEDDSIEIVSVISQAHISSFARSVVLDNLSTTSDGSYINLDVQKTPINDDIRRTRFHEGAITVTNTPKGTEFKDVPDVTVIFIAEYDVLGSGKMISDSHSSAKGLYSVLPSNLQRETIVRYSVQTIMYAQKGTYYV